MQACAASESKGLNHHSPMLVVVAPDFHQQPKRACHQHIWQSGGSSSSSSSSSRFIVVEVVVEVKVALVVKVKVVVAVAVVVRW